MDSEHASDIKTVCLLYLQQLIQKTGQNLDTNVLFTDCVKSI
jgi:hypothetical protein